MKNKLPIIIVAVVVVVLLAVGAGFMMLSSKAKPQAQTQTQANNTQTAQSQTVKRNAVKGTILSLIGSGQTVTCTVTLPDNKGAGTFYVASSKKFAGDITSKGTDGKDIETHMISDGTYVYIWSAAMPMGIKMNLSAARSAANNAQTSQTINMNQNVDMQCGPWSIDDSKFTIPSNVKFSDFSNLLPQGQAAPKTVAPQTGAGGTSPCDQITDPTVKAACTKALQGNGN
jgi:type II secretory pathway pseudopilin PulG